MDNVEIERKFLIKNMPELTGLKCRVIKQGYLNTSPTVRVRQDNDEYYLTYKSKSTNNISRQEYNLPLDAEAFEHLIAKCDGNIISKKRYELSVGKSSKGNELTAEIDVFDEPFAPLCIAEVEFESEEEAEAFVTPDWMGEDVSDKREYYNSDMAKRKF